MSINENVAVLAGKIMASLVYDAETSSIKEEKKNSIFEANLPQDLTMEVVKKVEGYKTEFVSAATYAIGQLAQKEIMADKKLNRIEATLAVGGDQLAVDYERSKQYACALPGKGTEGGEKITKFGVTTVAYTTKAGHNGGQLKIVRKELNELAAAAFK